MESQMIRSHDYEQAQEPPTVGDQQQQEGGEKKSVMKKVKDRAKKMRETIRNYGHGGHDHDQSDEMKTPPDDHDLDEEDSEEEKETVEDPAIQGPPEIHGAPMYESGAGTAAQTRRPEELTRPGATDELLARGDEGMKRSFHGDRADEVNGGDHLGRTGEFLETPQNTPVQSSDRRQPTFVPATVESTEQRKFNPEIPVGMDEDSTAPTANTNPTSNYQSKVTDPTGRGEEVRDITPMVESFGKLGMRDEQNRGEKQSMTAGESLPLPTGSHDQFNPRQGRPEPAEQVAEKMETSEPETQQEKSPSQGGYISAITSTAASLGSSLMSRAVGSGTATQRETTRPETGMDLQESEAAKAEAKQSSAAESVKQKVAPVYEKAAGAGTAVLSKIVGPGSNHQTNRETRELDSGVGGDENSGGEGKKVQDKGMSMSSYLSEKLKPGEEDEALSEVISEKLMMKKTPPPHDEEGSDIPVKGGMVDKLKGAVGSWFSKPGQPHPTEVEQKMGLGEEEKQLQESGN